jgi:hypothetical protein
MSTQTISMKVGQLPAELQREVGDYIEFLLYKYNRQGKNLRPERVQCLEDLQKLESRHKQGYANTPTKPDEFSVWEEEQVWGD